MPPASRGELDHNLYYTHACTLGPPLPSQQRVRPLQLPSNHCKKDV